MYHILYVDDNPDLLHIGKYFLESEGTFTVGIAESAGAALDQMKTVWYDGIVSDYQMPGMDGIDFLKAVRERFGNIPFILFTGHGREEVVIEAINNGVDFYLQKGGEPEAQFAELVHKILHAISRRLSDEAVKKSERDYRHLIEHANEAIYVVQDGTLRMVNPQTADMSGYSEPELINQPFTRFIHPDDCDMLLDRYRRRINGEDVPTRYSFRISRKDGTTRWVELSVVTLTWDGRPATLNFLTDITERKLAGDALSESEERYRQFFRTSLDSMFITTPDGWYIDFNDATVKIFGYACREDIVYVPITSLYAHPEERATFLKNVERDGYVKEHPLLLKKRDGTVFDALVTIVPQKNPDGSVKAFIGTIRDNTEQKLAEDALRESEKNFRSIVEYALEGILITDLSGNILFANRAAARILECEDCTGLIGRNVMVFIAPESKKEVMKDFDQVTHGHDGYLAHYKVISAKGREISVESIGKVIMFEGKQRDLVSFRSISEPVG
jgi:PAS domain S-box-containing protein